MFRDPHKPFDDRSAGVAMLCSVGFCAVTGIGIGVFFKHPEIGGLIGAALGILVGLWLVPALLRDWH
jgi:hypothetical protein